MVKPIFLNIFRLETSASNTGRGLEDGIKLCRRICKAGIAAIKASIA